MHLERPPKGEKMNHMELYNKIEISVDDLVVCSEPKFAHDNEMYTILWDFKIKAAHIIPARLSDLRIVTKKRGKKENLPNSRLCRFNSYYTEM